MKRRIVQVDADTGEEIEGYVAVVQPRRRNGYQRWFAMNQDAIVGLLDMMMERQLQMRDVQVLYSLLDVLDYSNLIQVSQAEVARRLNMQRSHVNRSIRKLTNLGVIHEGPRVGRSKTYRLNPDFGWKGSTQDHARALKERMSRAGIRVIDGGNDDQ